MHWIRTLAEEARRRAEVTEDPSEEELDRMAELLGVKIVYRAVPCPYCVHTPQGPLIVRPRHWRDNHGDAYSHELGHAVTNPGGGEIICAVWPGSPKHERLARLWRDRDEAYAEEFARVLRGQ